MAEKSTLAAWSFSRRISSLLNFQLDFSPMKVASRQLNPLIRLELRSYRRDHTDLKSVDPPLLLSGRNPARNWIRCFRTSVHAELSLSITSSTVKICLWRVRWNCVRYPLEPKGQVRESCLCTSCEFLPWISAEKMNALCRLQCRYLLSALKSPLHLAKLQISLYLKLCNS